MRRALLLSVLAAPGVFAQAWRVQYTHTQSGEALRVVDLAFPSAQEGVAIGTVVAADDPLQRPRPIALVTGDGGTTWDRVALEDVPVSVYFLSAAAGWMVGERSLWHSETAGRIWKRVSDHEARSIERVWFVDARRGFAVGRNKRVGSTSDGGVTWAAVEEAAKPSGNPDFTHYTHIAFADARRGLIVGAAVPPPSRPQTDVVAAGPVIRRPGPTLTLQLQTLNGGATWSSSTAPLFGQVAALDLASGEGLVVFDFTGRPGDRVMEWPTEVYRINLRSGGSSTVYRDKERQVTSALVFEESRAYLGATDPSTGRVHILSTAGMTSWTEMEVPARAAGSKVMLGGPDADHVWAATDSGVVLHLAR